MPYAPREATCIRCGQRFMSAKGTKEPKYCSKRCLSESRRLPVERFWERFDSSGGPDACWPWQGTRISAGYGWMSVRGKQVYAHRLMLELTGHALPEGCEVMHTCDNPACVNPQHLVVGDRAQNATDMVAKGRSAKGAHHSQAKLTADEVRQIRELCEHGYGHRWIGQQYGVDPSTVSLIKNRKRWTHI